MRNHLSLLFLLALVHGICLAQPTPPTEPSGQRELAKQLVSILGTGRPEMSALRNIFESKFPPSAKPVLQEIWNLEHWDWRAFEDHFIAVYAEIFSEEELKALLVFFATDVGRKWNSVTPMMVERIMARAEGETLPKMLAEVGCTLGMLLKAAEIIQASAKKDGRTDDEGALILRMKPAIPPTRSFCSCVMGKAANRWGGYANLQATQETPEYRVWMKEVVETECPVPKEFLESMKRK